MPISDESREEAAIAAPNDPQDQIPLQEPTFFILLSLAAGPRHGYAVMKDVQSLSRDRVLLSTSTLYSALKRLLDQGWIQRSPDPEPDDTGRERKAYRLSTFGRQVMEAEMSRMESLLAIARRRALEGNA